MKIQVNICQSYLNYVRFQEKCSYYMINRTIIPPYLRRHKEEAAKHQLPDTFIKLLLYAISVEKLDLVLWQTDGTSRYKTKHLYSAIRQKCYILSLKTDYTENISICTFK